MRRAVANAVRSAAAALALFAAAGCGGTPEPVLEATEWFGQAGHLTVKWSVNDEGTVANCPGRGDMTIETFPSGWFCWWECGFYENRWQQVWIDVDVADGRFVPADEFPVYTGACFDDGTTCPTCNFE